MIRVAGAWMLALVPVSCSGRDEAPQPHSGQIVHALTPPGGLSPAPAPPPVTPAPLAEPVYATSLEELHQIWCARFERLARPNPDARALIPYADAVELHGASWGIAPESVQLVLRNAAGEARVFQGVEHPSEFEAGAQPEWLRALTWADLASGQVLRHRIEGLGARLIGPLFASESCTACHAYRANALVGAILYEVEEIADD